MDSLNTHYSNMDQQSASVTSPREGHPCVAVFEDDNMWYRARIETLSNDGATIRFIDYGNTQQAKISDLKEIDSQFLQLPILAVECTLDEQKSLWIAEETEKFKMVTGEEKLTAEVTRQESSKYVVRILQDGNCVTDSLLQPTAVHGDIPAQVLHPNQTENVYVVFAKSSSEVCIQLSSYSDQLEQVMATIEHACESSTTGLPADQVVLGMPCCALFEDAWYRAVVTSPPSQGEVTVEYVDYGNAANLTLSELRSIPVSCIALPRQAIHCVLDGAGLEAVSKDTLENTLMDTPLSASFIRSDGSQWIVQLKQDNVDVIDMLLINSEVSIKDVCFVEQEVIAGSSFQGYVSFTVSPCEFYIQKTSSTEDLEMLDSRLNEVYGQMGSTIPHPKLEVGSICAALYSEDGHWYRALIIAIPDASQVQVHFVDHGNSEVVPITNTTVLKEEFLNLPILAMKCCLDKPGSSWTDDDLNKFEALVLDQELTVEFTEQQESCWIVNLMYQGTSLLSLIKVGDNLEEPAIVSTQADAMSYTWAKLPIDQTADVKFLMAEGENTIWLQPLATENDLVTLMHNIAENPPSQPLPVSKITKDEPCLSKFTEDDEWYRAEIVECHNDQVTVKYVDYGNAETVETSRVSPISEALLSLPAQAIKCYLHGVQSLSEELKNKWNEENFEVQLKAEVVEQKDCVYFIKLYEPDGRELILNLTDLANGETSKEPVAVTRQKSLDDQQLVSESTMENVEGKEENAEEKSEDTENGKQRQGIAEPYFKESPSQSVEDTTEEDTATVTVVPSKGESLETMQPLSQENLETERANRTDTDLTAEELAYYSQAPEIHAKTEPESSQQTPSDSAILAQEDESSPVVERCTALEVTAFQKQVDANSHTELVPDVENSTINNDNCDETENNHLKNNSVVEVTSGQLQGSSTKDESISEVIEPTTTEEEFSSALQKDMAKSIMENSVKSEDNKLDLNQESEEKSESGSSIENDVLNEGKETNLDSHMASVAKCNAQGILSKDKEVPIQNIEKKDVIESSVGIGISIEDKELIQDNQAGVTECIMEGSISSYIEDLNEDFEKKDATESAATYCISVIENDVSIEDKKLSQDNKKVEVTDSIIQGDLLSNSKEYLNKDIKKKAEIETSIQNGVSIEDSSLSDDNKDVTQNIQEKDESDSGMESGLLKEDKEMTQEKKKNDVQNMSTEANEDVTHDNNSGDVIDQTQQNGSSQGKGVQQNAKNSVDESNQSIESLAIDVLVEAEAGKVEPSQDLSEHVESNSHCCEIQEACSNDGSMVSSDKNQEQHIVGSSEVKEAEDNLKISESSQEERSAYVSKDKDQHCENMLMSKKVEKGGDAAIDGKHESQEYITGDVSEDKDIEKVTNGHVNGQEVASHDIEIGALKKAVGLTEDNGAPHSDSVEEKKKSCKPM